MARLQDKVVVITGGAGGIGAATARRMAEEGGTVVIADLADDQGRGLADEIAGSYTRLDVTVEDQWRQTVDGVRCEHGRIDVLVNAAGIEGDVLNGSPETTSLQEWHKVLAVNLDGTFLGCKQVLPVMGEAGKGAIVNVSSQVSFFGTPFTAAYGASKAGVEQLTRSVALHGARDGVQIRCNSVHPGVIQTRMVDSIYEQIGKASNLSREEAEAGTLAHVPLGHLGEPDDVAFLILYLASDEAKYVTGSAFSVDGGWHLVQAG
jgi:3(or 17)beta-hydroxysteroid dehydrogenase